MKVEGLDNVLRNLKKLDPKEWRKDFIQEMRADHKPVRSAMKANTPVDSGSLRRSIRTNAWTKKRSGGDVALFVRTGPNLRGKGRKWYAHFPELGTSGQSAQHYVKDTFQQYKSRLEEGISNAIRGLVKKANG